MKGLRGGGATHRKTRAVCSNLRLKGGGIMRWLVALISLSALVLVAIGGEVPEYGGKLILARTQDVVGLDPHTATAHASHRVFELVYNRLVGLDKDLLPIPELAQSWVISEDGKEYTFYLRQNVKFHNGANFTSADVKASIERILDEKTGSPVRSYFVEIQEIITPDPHIVVFKLKRPLASMLIYFSLPNASIISKDLVNADLNKPENVIGTGPFKLIEWVPDQYMRLKKNEAYFEEGKPYLDEIEIRIIPEESSIVAALRTGEVHFALIENPVTAITIRGIPGVQLSAIPSLRYHLVFINTSRGPLNDVRVRQAISLAIDRQTLIDVAAMGEGVVCGPIPPSNPYWAVPVTELFGYKRDVEQAKLLLKEAGYPNGFKVKLMAPIGEPATAIAEAQFIKAQLREIGIEVEVEPVEFGVYIDRWLKADLDMCMGVNAGAPDPDFYLYRYFHSTGPLQFVIGYWNNPRLDLLLDQGRQEVDLAKRRAIYAEAQKILAQEVPFIWLFSGYEYFAYVDSVKGFVPLSTGSIEYMKNVWLDP